MRKICLYLLGCLLTFSATHLFADIAAIHASSLPQETAILGALDDAKQLEPYSRSWALKWEYPVPKDEVADRLGKDLGFLTLALKNHSDNAELALLTGLVARYAYNLDVTGSYDEAMSALGHSEKIKPTDFRASWFRATLQCQTNDSMAGANEFLSIEAAHGWDQLPVAFWDDYMECASVTNMPSHLLRAKSYTEREHAPESAMRSFLAGAAQKRFDPFDANKTYGPKEAWKGTGAGEDTVFTSTMCGVRLHAHGSWEVNQLAFNNGSCVAYFGTGSYKAITTDLHPSVLMLIQRPKEGESLQDFSKKFLSSGTFEPDSLIHCPATHCIALKGIQPGMYKADGDGHGRIVFFERDDPEFPELIFESPNGPPKPDSGGAPVYYRPNQVQQRIPGKLYYLVMLDTAASIEESAMKDFDFFLQNLTVE